MKSKKIDTIKYCISRKKPLLLWKLLKLYAGIPLGIKPKFRIVEIATTYDCNLNCEHCSAETLKDDKRQLTFEDYRKLGEECKRFNVPCVSFTGGEPFIDKRIEEIVTFFNPKETLIVFTTNGTLLPKERINNLKKLGVDNLLISIDSANPLIHDSFRNSDGAFKKSINAITDAKEVGLDVTILFTLNHENFKSEFFGMINLAREMDVKLHISPAAPAGKWANKDFYKKYMLTDKDREILKDLRKKYPFIKRDFDANYGKKGCPAGTERICLTPSGEVMPCTKIHVSFGNIRKDSLVTIRERILKHSIFNETPPICVAAESRSLIKNHMSKSFGLKKTLLSEKEFFGVDGNGFKTQ